MPFVQRVVAPVRLSRAKLHDENGVPTVRDRELDAVTNCALSNALRQMSSMAALADEVFRELRGQLADVATRSAGLKCRVQALGRLVDDADPKTVTVRKSPSRVHDFFLTVVGGTFRRTGISGGSSDLGFRLSSWLTYE